MWRSLTSIPTCIRTWILFLAGGLPRMTRPATFPPPVPLLARPWRPGRQCRRRVRRLRWRRTDLCGSGRRRRRCRLGSGKGGDGARWAVLETGWGRRSEARREVARKEEQWGTRAGAASSETTGCPARWSVALALVLAVPLTRR